MTRSEILDKAKECVCGQREQDYGKPEDNFATIAALWSAYKDIEFSAEDVSVMMALMKIARIKSGTSTDDCFVDLAGYAACGGEIAGDTRFTDIHDGLEPFCKAYRVGEFDGNIYIWFHTDEDRDKAEEAFKNVISQKGSISTSDLCRHFTKGVHFEPLGWPNGVRPACLYTPQGAVLELPAPVNLITNRKI